MKFEQQFRVLNFEADPWRRMSVGALLRRAQEIATDQCTELGLTDEVYSKTGTAFLLARVSLKVNKMPQIGQTVRMQTRPYAVRRAVYTRITSFYDEGGALLCETDSRWVLVNTETRRILRKSPENFPDPFETECCEEHCFDVPKLNLEDMTKTASLKADYSFCDKNMHINNTRYADIVFDRLPLEKLKEGAAKRVVLHYKNEIKLGSSFDVHEKVDENGRFCFLLTQESVKNFEAFVEF